MTTRRFDFHADAETKLVLRVDERADALEERHRVPLEVPADALDLEPSHRVLARQQARRGLTAIDLEADPVQIAAAVAGEHDRRFAQRLRGERAGVHGRASGIGRALDDGDALAEVRCLRGAFFASRSTAEDDEIEVVGHGGRVHECGAN